MSTTKKMILRGWGKQPNKSKEERAQVEQVGKKEKQKKK